MRHAASRPVFVDRTGRRRRIMLISGVGLATLLASGLVVLIVGLSGGSGWHVPGFPEANPAVNGPDAEATPAATSRVGPTADQTGAVSPSDAVTNASASAEPSTPRRVPTQTPSHPPKPTKPN